MPHGVHCGFDTFSSARCEGILSEALPAKIIQASATTKSSLAPLPERKNIRVRLQLRKRTLYAGRDAAKRKVEDALLFLTHLMHALPHRVTL